MRHYSLLLGAALGLAVSATAFATDLPNTAKPAEHVKVRSHGVEVSTSVGYARAFYYEQVAPIGDRRLYIAGFDLQANYDGAFLLDTNKFFVTGLTARFGPDKAWKKISDLRRMRDPLLQKLMSSSAFSGTPGHGFTNLAVELSNSYVGRGTG